jgi:Protein of unknown function (DUF3551)
MRYVLIGIALMMMSDEAAFAQDYSTSQYCSPWCLQFRSGSQDCSYNNFEQCRASQSGVGGVCVRNPFLYQCTRKPGRRPRH